VLINFAEQKKDSTGFKNMSERDFGSAAPRDQNSYIMACRGVSSK